MVIYDKIEDTPEYEAGFLACMEIKELNSSVGPEAALREWKQYRENVIEGYWQMVDTQRQEARFRYFKGWDAAR